MQLVPDPDVEIAPDPNVEKIEKAPVVHENEPQDTTVVEAGQETRSKLNIVLTDNFEIELIDQIPEGKKNKGLLVN